MSLIKRNLQGVIEAIESAQHGVNARRGDAEKSIVRLIAVSKTRLAATIREAFACGQRAFSENYVQEAVAKFAELIDLRAATPEPGIEWHFIGPLQRNKAKLAAQHFDWVHSVDREPIARALSAARSAAELAPLNVCVQVNVSGEAAKSGVAPTGVAALIDQIRALPGLHLRGLMTIIENTPDEIRQRAQFQTMRELFNAECARLADEKFDTLSMGMSQDFQVAIDEGSTMVRIGTAIFGARS